MQVKLTVCFEAPSYEEAVTVRDVVMLVVDARAENGGDETLTNGTQWSRVETRA